MNPPHVPVGFDYAATVEELHRSMSYPQIAEFCGYETAEGVLKVARGAIPSHPQGEALWVLYKERFGRRPPVTEEQTLGQWHYLSKLPTSKTAA